MRYVAIFTTVVLALALGLQAQTRPSDSTADQMLRDMLNAPPDSGQSLPTTRPDVPVMQPRDHADPLTHLLREGSDIVGRSGRLVKTGGPYPRIVFDDERENPAAKPMYILPDLRLMQMEDAGSVATRDLHFTVNGEVTEYQGANYVLLDAQPLEPEADSLPPLGSHPTTAPASPDQMLNEMLATDSRPAQPDRPPLQTDTTSGSGAVPPSAPVLTVLREGSHIVDRICRLTTGDNQQKQINFESDGMALRDPPLIVLPSLKLAAMEAAQSAATHDPKFRVSGMVTEYRGRNYILLEKVVVVPDAISQF